MKMLEDRIRKDGIVREGNVLKVDGRKSSLRLCVTATEMLLLSAQWKTSIL